MKDLHALLAFVLAAIVVLAGLVLFTSSARAAPAPCRWEVRTLTTSTMMQDATMPDGWEPVGVVRSTAVTADLMLRRCR